MKTMFKKAVYLQCTFFCKGASLLTQTVKNLPEMRDFEPLVGKIPWRKAWQPAPVFLPGKSSWTEEPGGL